MDMGTRSISGTRGGGERLEMTAAAVDPARMFRAPETCPCPRHCQPRARVQ